MRLTLWCLSAAVLVYVYVGYPLLLTLLARPRRGPRHFIATPSVTVVFCAYNEATVLVDKIANCRALDYPKDQLTFAVGSDASTDATDQVLETWAQADSRVQVWRAPVRQGKTALLNSLVPQVPGEIVLFTDAATRLLPDAVQQHVARYMTAGVAAVGGDLTFVNAGRTGMSTGHGLFWRYERHLRQCEAALGVLTTVAGANYSVRRRCWRPIPPQYADDCVTPLTVVAQGYRVAYAPEAGAQEVAAERPGVVWRRRVRMVTRDLAGTLTHPVCRTLWRRPGVAWALLSHKLLRWLGAPLLVVLLLSTVALVPSLPLMRAVLAVQLGFYGLAGLGAVRGTRRPWLAVPLYFTLSNLAILWGMGQVLRGKRAATW